MAKYSNRQILAAVLNKWAQPAIRQLAGKGLEKMPCVDIVERWIRSTGIVSRQWRIGDELSPWMGSISSSLVEPMLNQYLQHIPDEAIPSLAHGIVDDAIKNGRMSLLEGTIELELEELKKLLRYNLPIVECNGYEVITEEPMPQGENVAE